MEQRKVLLIIISITVILAATIGVGLLLFYPRDDAPEATAETEFWDPMDFLTGSGSRPGLATDRGTAGDADGPDRPDGDDEDRVGDASPTGDDQTPEPDGPFSVTYGVIPDARGDQVSDDSPTTDSRPRVTIAERAPSGEDPARTDSSSSADASPAAEPMRPSQPVSERPSTPAARTATPDRAPAVTRGETLASRAYWVQLISSPNRDTVEQAQRSLGEHQVHTRIQTKEIGDTVYYRLRLGPFSVREEAEKFLDWILDSDRFADALIFVDYTTSVRAPSGS